MAVRDRNTLISPRIAPFRTGMYGITWVNVGVKRPEKKRRGLFAFERQFRNSVWRCAEFLNYEANAR